MSRRWLTLGSIALFVGGLLLALVLNSGEQVIPIHRPQGSTPLLADEGRDVALSFAVAFNSVDYRDPDAWLEGISGSISARFLELLRRVLIPTSWHLFATEKRIIPGSEVVAEDKGMLARGPNWQVRLVIVHLSKEEAALESTETPMHLLLIMQGEEWLVDSLLSRDEVSRLAALSEDASR